MTLTIWHPFTQHGTEPPVICIEKAEGVFLYGQNSDSYIDAISSWWTTLHGHSHPRLNQALHQQAERMEHVMFSGFTHPPAQSLSIQLGQALDEPCLSHLFFSDNGSTAVEVALKMATQYFYNQGFTHKKIFLAFEGAYHGDTFGAMAVGQGSGYFAPFLDLLPQVILLPYPETWIGDETVEKKEALALSALDKIIAEHGDSIITAIIEPLVQGASGMRMCRPEFVKAFVERLKQAGILTIFDEIAVGFGRTGSIFAFQQCGVVPDMICLSKGLTGGYMPLSVTICQSFIYEAFYDTSFKKAFAHGHSFTANPLACSVATESISMLLEEETFNKTKIIEETYRQELPRLQASGRYHHFRIRGTIFAMDWIDGECSVYKSPLSEKWKRFFLSQGINLRPLGGTVYLLPPYCITPQQIRQIIDVLVSDKFDTFE